MPAPLAIRAYALSQNGHEIKIQLPPRTTRAVRVQSTVPSHPVLDRALALRTILLVEVEPSPLEASLDPEILLYNGGFDTQWITHGQILAYSIPSGDGIGPSRPGT